MYTAMKVCFFSVVYCVSFYNINYNIKGIPFGVTDIIAIIVWRPLYYLHLIPLLLLFYPNLRLYTQQQKTMTTCLFVRTLADRVYGKKVTETHMAYSCLTSEAVDVGTHAKTHTHTHKINTVILD